MNLTKVCPQAVGEIGLEEQLSEALDEFKKRLPSGGRRNFPEEQALDEFLEN